MLGHLAQQGSGGACLVRRSDRSHGVDHPDERGHAAQAASEALQRLVVLGLLHQRVAVLDKRMGAIGVAGGAGARARRGADGIVETIGIAVELRQDNPVGERFGRGADHGLVEVDRHLRRRQSLAAGIQSKCRLSTQVGDAGQTPCLGAGMVACGSELGEDGGSRLKGARPAGIVARQLCGAFGCAEKVVADGEQHRPLPRKVRVAPGELVGEPRLAVRDLVKQGVDLALQRLNMAPGAHPGCLQFVTQAGELGTLVVDVASQPEQHVIHAARVSGPRVLRLGDERRPFVALAGGERRRR